MTQPIYIINGQARNLDPLTQAIAAYLSEQLGQPFTHLTEPHWQERYALLGSGEVGLGWICGMPYVKWLEDKPASVELVVAPVMQGELYGNQPVYFSHVTIKQDSPFQTFADLRGCRWAYNEPGSQSGYHIVAYKLAQIGANHNFFGQVQASDGHLKSLELILNGQIDASAIDTTVFDFAIAENPSLLEQVRILDTLGPSPIPPLVIRAELSTELKSDIRQALLNLHKEPRYQPALQHSQVSHLVAVEDADYDPIRRMSEYVTCERKSLHNVSLSQDTFRQA